MDQKKFDAIREGAQRRRAAREAQQLTEAATPELIAFDSVDALIAATQKAK